MMRRHGGAQSPSVLPFSGSPGTLWGVVVGCVLLFSLLMWPSAPPAALPGAGVAGASADAGGRRAGPADVVAAPAAAAAVQQQRQGGGGSGSGSGSKVNLELFVMSRCPDASYCEHAFDKVLARTKAFVTVSPRFIQTANDDGSISAPHGDSEVTGNLFQLCVAAHTPPERNYDM